MFGHSESLVMVQMRVEMWRNFLERVGADVAREFDEIEARCAAGEFQDELAYESAMNFPLGRLEIAARAVAYEIVAMTELELRSVAREPWLRDGRFSGPKRVDELDHVNSRALGRLKTVFDLHYSEVVRLVENHYGIDLDDLPGWKRLSVLRDAVNSFKHRASWKRPKEIDWDQPGVSMGEIRNEVSFDQISEDIDAFVRFVRTLWASVGSRK